MAGETIAVEVKTRGAGPADPAERFTPAKAAKVRQAARRLPRRASRIDLVTVSLGDDGVDIRWVPRAG